MSEVVYSIGVSLSPYLMSLALTNQANWRQGYQNVFYIQLIIAIICIMALPLWNRSKACHMNISEEEQLRTLKLSNLLQMPAVRAVCLIFFGSCAIEYTCGVWGSTFMVNAKMVSVDYAARTVTFYYAGIALGRFLAGVLANKLSALKLIYLGQCIILAAIVLLLLPVPTVFSCMGLFLVGLGNAPVFPNLIHLTPENFGKEISQSVMGIQMASSYVGIMLMPPVFGLLAQNIHIKLFPYFLMVMYTIMIAATMYLAKIKKRIIINNYN